MGLDDLEGAMTTPARIGTALDGAIAAQRASQDAARQASAEIAAARLGEGESETETEQDK